MGERPPLSFTLDHVELFVPDREQAADWYAKVFGCQRIAGTESWAQHPQGPLMLTPDGGRTKLALFTGEPPGSRPTAGFHRVAFRLGGEEWLAFVARVNELGLAEGRNVPRVTDHTIAWSVYFSDPFGHNLEVTTYDAELVHRARGAA
jgi:catechol 2,3-dioxygenase-like lactoylglutathione lyase family enzyme